MKEKGILVIDTGSSSMRGILFLEDGSIQECRQIHYSMQIDGDRAVQDVTDFSEALISLAAAFAEYTDKNGMDIEAISFTSQRSSLIILDENGKVLLPAMMWYDKRADEICRKLNRDYGGTLKAVSGSKADSVLLAPKIRYFQENGGSFVQKAAHYLSIQDYLIWFVCGEMVTDPTLACRTNLMDLDTEKWSERLLEIYGIEKAKMCRIVPCGSIVGYVKQEFLDRTGLRAKIPVITAGGDQQCSVLGQFLLEEKQAGMTIGSGGYVTCITKERLHDSSEEEILYVSSALRGKYHMELGVGKVGTLFNWCVRQLHKETPEEFLSEAACARAAANGVTISFEHLENCMMHNKNLTKEDFEINAGEISISVQARALLECIVGKVCEAYRVLCKKSGAGHVIRIAGGLARSDLVCQMVSDMTGAAVYRSKEVETTALGAWMQSMTALDKTGSLEETVRMYEKNGTDRASSVFVPDERKKCI